MNLSKLLSYILHPIFMPFLVLYIGLNYVDYFNLLFSNHRKTLYIIILLFTITLPFIATLIFVRTGKAESLELRKKEERNSPLLFTVLIMTLGFFFFNTISKLSETLTSIYISSLLILVFSFLITKKWKISLHMLGIGGATGTFISLKYIFGDLYWFVILFFFLSGLLAFARLAQKAHNHSQVYVGFLLGCIFQTIFIVNYSSIISTISILRSSIASLL